MDALERAKRLVDLRADLRRRLMVLAAAIDRGLHRDEPFGIPNGTTVLEVIQIEAYIAELIR